MTILRESARDQHCTVRIPGICRRDTETTILAHYRLAGISGMGLKPPDVCAALSCGPCHDAVDGRIRTEFSREALHLMHLQGCMRTIAWWHKHGFIVIERVAA